MNNLLKPNEISPLLAIEEKLKNALSLASTNPELTAELVSAQLILKNESARIATEILRTSRRLDDSSFIDHSSIYTPVSKLKHPVSRAAIKTHQSLEPQNLPGDPGSDAHRHAALHQYGIQLTSDHQENRTISEDAKADLFKPSSKELQHSFERQKRTKIQLGLLTLIERKLIPAAADLTIEPAPFNQTQLVLKDKVDTPRRSHGPTPIEDKMQLSIYKLDDRQHSITMQDTKSLYPASAQNSSFPVPQNSRQPSAKLISLGHPSAPPATREIACRSTTSHLRSDIAVINFEIKYLPQIELSFERHNQLDTFEKIQIALIPPQKITTSLQHELQTAQLLYERLTQLVSKFSIPKLVIDSARLMKLAKSNLLTSHLLHIRDVVDSSVSNSIEVRTLISIPGRKYKHPDKTVSRNLAATTIQASWRAYIYNTQYRCFRKKRWAAGVIAISWIMYVRMAKMRRRLTTSRKRQIEYHARKLDRLNFQNASKHSCVVHIPSLSYSQPVRLPMDDLKIRQGVQWGRLADAFNPNIDRVIYVLATPLSVEIENYWRTVLSIYDEKAFEKIYFISPEATSSFPTHNMSLATVLKYSPEAINQIKSLIATYVDKAYIVPAVATIDDLAVAELLNLPILAPKFEAIEKFTHCKSNVKDVLKNVGEEVDSPPVATHLYSLEDITESLGDLYVRYPKQEVWLLKLNHNIGGRGIMRLKLNADTLPCFSWFQNEVNKFNEQWKHQWAHETALNRLLRELPEAITANSVCQNNDMIKKTKLYTSWVEFAKDLKKFGCVLELEPEGADEGYVMTVSVDVFIPPNEEGCEIICSGDQLHAGNHLQHWGSTLPQTSIKRETLEEAVDKVVRKLAKNEGICGYLTLDFLTFFNDDEKQVLWVTDFKLGMSNQLCMYKLGSCLANPATENYMAVCPHMVHTNLSCVHYSVLFQMLTAYAVGWDMRKKSGCLVALVDTLAREHLGIVTVQNSLESALTSLARALAVIDKEISSPSMQGETNFHAAIKEIDSILYTMTQKKE